MNLPNRYYCAKHDCWHQREICIACQAEGYALCVKDGRIPKPDYKEGAGQRDIDPDPETIRLRAAMVKAMGLCGDKDAQKLARKLESDSFSNKSVLQQVGLTEDDLDEKEDED